MNDYPEVAKPYGELPDELDKEACELCKDKTIEQLRMLGDYFHSKASNMTRELEKNVKIEDYEKLLKRDSDEEIQ